MAAATVLVTGATGFIGSHLVKRLLECGSRVRCVTRGNSTVTGAETVRGDYASGAGLKEAVDGVETVFHLAGVTKALRPEDYFAGNAAATENLARVCAVVPRFVHVSSLAAVGPSSGSSDLTEDAEPHPVSNYGCAKLQGEQAVRRLLPGAVIVRPPVVYGPGDRDVLEMLRSLARGIDLRIGREERWFSAIYVGDLVEALLAAAQSDGAGGRTYFVAHAEPVSWTVFAATAGGILKRRARRITISARTASAAGTVAGWWAGLRGRPSILSADKLCEALYPRWTCSAELARRELGFVAATGLEDGLARTIGWYKEQGWL